MNSTGARYRLGAFPPEIGHRRRSLAPWSAAGPRGRYRWPPRHGARRSTSAGAVVAPRSLPRPGRRRPRRRARARSCCSRGPTAPARPPCCGPAPGLVPVAERRGRGARPRPAPPTGGRCGRRVGLLGHATGLYDDLTVADNVRFWARAARRRAGRRRRRAGPPRPRRPPARRRRSAGSPPASAAAPRWPLVARRPELWLLDEPHAGLDQAGRDHVDGLVAEAVGRRAPPCCSPPTSSTGPTAWPTAPSPSPAAPIAIADDGVGVDRRRRATGRPPTPMPGRCPVFRDAALVAGKDLRLEARSRVGAQPGRAVRPAGAGAVRLRPRPRPGRCSTGHARPVLVAVLFVGAARRPAGLRRRGGRRQPRRPAPVGPRPGRDLPRQGRGRSPSQLLVLEVAAGRRRASSSTALDLDGLAAAGR